MNYSIMMSLRMFLDEYMPEVNDVKMIYDGQDTSQVPKPYLTVESLPGNDAILSAGRMSYEEIYRFQVGVFARNIGERFMLEEKVKTQLRRPDGIPVYTQTGLKTDARFVADVSAFTPISNDAPDANVSQNHRGYFDVAVEIFRDTGDTEFTQ